MTATDRLLLRAAIAFARARAYAIMAADARAGRSLNAPISDRAREQLGACCCLTDLLLEVEGGNWDALAVGFPLGGGSS